MLSKILAGLALVGTAAAYAPTMSMGMGRREVLKTAAAGAIAAPLLRNAPAEAKPTVTGNPARLGSLEPLVAPVITILDHRGCESNKDHKEYKGKPSGDDNDEMCVVVRQSVIKVPEEDAAKLRQEFLGMKETAINVPQIAQLGPLFKERY